MLKEINDFLEKEEIRRLSKNIAWLKKLFFPNKYSLNIYIAMISIYIFIEIIGIVSYGKILEFVKLNELNNVFVFIIEILFEPNYYLFTFSLVFLCLFFYLRKDMVIEDNGIFDEKPQIFSLSNKAQQLIKEVSLDKNGVIMFYQGISDAVLKTNKKSFISSSERREILEWQKALEELVSESLIVDKNGKFEYFKITDVGYKFVDNIDFNLVEI